MNRPLIIKILLLTCLVHVLPVFAGTDTKPVGDKTDVTPAAQNQFAPIIINGRALTGPFSSALRRAGGTYVHITAVARGLGDLVSIDPVTRTVSVRRQTGSTGVLDARLGQIRENGSVILSVSDTSSIIFTPDPEEFLLSLELAAAIFDVAIRYDGQKNAVLITRGLVQTASGQSSSTRRPFELYQLNYDYNLTGYASATAQNLVLSGGGRLADGRFNFMSTTTSSSFRQISLRNITFNFERQNGQRFTAGDFGAAQKMQFLSAYIRGGEASVSVGGGVMIAAFAGRSASGTIWPNPLDQIELQPAILVRNRYGNDTNIFGAYATRTFSSNGSKANQLSLLAGAMRFGGPDRSGELASTTMIYDGRRFRFQGDFGVGSFKGAAADNSHINGIGTAADLAGTFQLTENLAIQARYVHIGQNFLSPQHGLRDPVDLKAAGVTWSPVKWLSTSFNASTSNRPGRLAQQDSSVNGAISITPGGTAPRFYISHTQSSSTQVKDGAFTLFNASKDFSRWRMFVNAMRIKSIGPASINSQLGMSFRVNDSNSFEISQGVGSKRSYNGQFDWRTSNLFHQRLSFSAGGGYNYTASSKFSSFERLTASVVLPRQTSLQVSYIQTNAGPTLLVSVRGTLFRKREAAAFLNASASDINSFAKVSGRVYQDTNLNGKYDAGVDQPQADVKVRVDGNRYVVSDANGMFQFESITAGDHKVYLDLLSVRADLTLLDNPTKESALQAGRDSTIDFRLVRTGRVRGRVWLDLNENGKFDDGETPLADVRVVTGSGRDTLTDADGYFVIGDLAPGEHVILIDEKTLPQKTKSGFSPRSVQVFPGRETGDLDLSVIMIPAEVKRFGSHP